jgi:hypothetical protein
MVLLNSPVISSIVFVFPSGILQMTRKDGWKEATEMPSLFDHLPSPSGRAAPMCRVQAMPLGKT